MLGLLRNSGRFHSSAPHDEADFFVGVEEYNTKVQNPPITYYYVSRTGELGKDKEWCYVPAEFKKSMLRIKAGLPKHKLSHPVTLGGVTTIVPN